jgi:ATP-dependent helicase/nuclease subunit B
LELAFEQTPLPLSNWLGVVESGLANLTAGIIPLALDEVLIGEVERSRNPNLELALVLGLNETVFPAPPPPPALLSPLDRETLVSSGLRLGRTQREHIGHERLLGYLACTRARRRLVLTYAQRNGNDQPLNPSPFIDHLQRIFPDLKAEPVAATLDWRQSIHPTELVVPLLQNKVKGANECKIQSLARLEKLTLFAPVLDRWEQLVAAQSVRQLSPGQAEKLYGANLQTSISKLEDYAACPFKFFVGAGLRAEERQQFEADQRERGSFQHEILMEFHRRLQAKGKRWRDFGPAEAREFIGQIGSELQQSFRDGLFVSSAERQFMARTLIEGLQKFIAVLVRWAPQYLFEPQAVEIGFGMEGDSLDPWRIDLGGGHFLLLRGRIDRVDLQPQADNTACAVVIDYKSSGQELTEVKLVNGLDLQLLAYLGVLRDAPKSHEVFGVSRLVPAGAFYVSLRSNAPSGKNRTEVLADPDWVRLLGYQHRGRFRADLLEQFDNRHEPRGNQFRYRRNQDGAFSRVGNEVLPEQDFLALVDQIEGFLRRYGQEIYNGDVRVAPYRHKNETACDYCEFRPICRFDPWIEPYRVLKTAAQGGRRRQT